MRRLEIVSWHPEPLTAVEIWSVPEILLDGRPLLAGWLGELEPTVSGVVESRPKGPRGDSSGAIRSSPPVA